MKLSTINKNLIKPQKELIYERNLKKILGWEEPEIKILKKAAGILKGRKLNAVKLQRGIRKEWENRLRKIERLK
ncbi:MAG: hypothetical protein KY055_02605 [Candidatus Nealsonbacteria bacterium]|nr:hypothetical protein [Candidatus Nealsonbacteria bacterium]